MREYMSPENKINTIKQEGNRDVIYEIMMREIRAAPAEQERILKEWATASEAVKKLRITAHVKDVANELLEIIDGLQMEMEASGRFSQSPSPMPSPMAVRRSRSPVRRRRSLGNRRSLGLSGSPTNTRHRSRSRRSSSNRVVRRGGKKRKTMKRK